MTTRRTSHWLLVRLALFTVVAIVVTILVATTLLNLQVGSTSTYEALFTNGSAIQAGDVVGIAGVQVGRVDGVTLTAHNQALVRFSISSDQHLTTTTLAQIHFENLLGERYLDLIAGSTPGQPLRSGAMIPVARTEPALDLTAVFNGFQPLFSALTPDQVNQLSGSLIQVFQGQGGNLTNLTEQVASISNKLADRQVVIDQLIDNLSGLLGKVGSHDQQLGQLIDSFTSVVKSLASERPQIASTIDGVKQLNAGVSNILGQSQPDLNQSISGLASVSKTLAVDQNALNATIGNFPGLITTLTKVVSTGSYLGIYICNLTIQTQGELNISLIPGVPAPQPGDPLVIPSGPVGNQTQHTASCQ